MISQERKEAQIMKEWLERLTDAQRAMFAELGEHVSLVILRSSARMKDWSCRTFLWM